MAQQRAKTFGDMVEQFRYFYAPIQLDPKAQDEVPGARRPGPILEEIRAGRRGAARPRDRAAGEGSSTAGRRARGLGIGKVAQPVRVALTGGTASPGIYDVVQILGKEEALRGSTTPSGSSAREGHEREAARPANFLAEIIEADLAAGRNGGRVVTRFPPEPNGFLHIGHAKSVLLNFGLARRFGGRAHLRFDDTNPTTEETEYVDAIQEDVRWLGCDWGTHLYYASDFFERMYDCAERLIREGKAYVDDQSVGGDPRAARQLRAPRAEQPVPRPPADGEPRALPPHARRRAPRRRARAARAHRHGAPQRAHARSAALPDPSRALTTGPATAGASTRCTTSPIRSRTRFEGVTHSICTLEFESNRELYDWVLDQPRARGTRGRDSTSSRGSRSATR